MLITRQIKKMVQTTEFSKRVGKDIPTLLTKKWLANHYGCATTDGRVITHKLFRYVLTMDVLHHIGITESVCRQKAFKTFNAIQSELLKEKLSL